MPRTNLYLLSFQGRTTPRSFLQDLFQHPTFHPGAETPTRNSRTGSHRSGDNRVSKPDSREIVLTAARPIRWIIRPTHYDTDILLEGAPSTSNASSVNSNDPRTTPYYLLLILAPGYTIPFDLLTNRTLIRTHFTLTVGIPSSLLSNYHDKNTQLLSGTGIGQVPPLTGSLRQKEKTRDGGGDTRNLELSEELQGWSQRYMEASGGSGSGGHGGAVSMLNLLAFEATKDARDTYAKYGRAFAERVGSARGGLAKLVGKVVADDQHNPSGSRNEKQGPSSDTDIEESRRGKSSKKNHWHEIALAHYPSLAHFLDMIASEDYQEANKRYRLGSLEDTCILMCDELDEGILHALSGKDLVNGVGEGGKGAREGGAKI
ncbi:MAG: hypothetical protein M1831_003185 [Alyxoria varia]|nr:MAG: hypothetical protein M1831_003185 [Alyxoria varia]